MGGPPWSIQHFPFFWMGSAWLSPWALADAPTQFFSALHPEGNRCKAGREQCPHCEPSCHTQLPATLPTREAAPHAARTSSPLLCPLRPSPARHQGANNGWLFSGTLISWQGSRLPLQSCLWPISVSERRVHSPLRGPRC